MNKHVLRICQKNEFRMFFWVIPLIGVLCIFISSCNDGEAKLLNQANDYIIEKKLDKAEEILKKVIAENPKSALAHNNLGFIYLETKKFNDAKKEFETALDIYTKPSDEAIALNNLGMTYEKMKNLETAKKYYENAIKTDPKYSVTYVNFATMLNDLNDNETALTLLKKGLKENPNNTQLLYTTGELAARNQNIELAIKSYEQLCKLVPFSPGYRAYLGVLYLQSVENEKDDNILNKAKQSLDSAVSLDIKNALAHAGLGEYYRLTDDLDNAEKSVRKSLDLKPDLVYGHIVLGKIYLTQNKLNEAKDIFAKGMQLDPRNKVIPELMKKINNQ